MRVLSIDRLYGPGSTLAHASVQITPDVRVNDIRLVRANGGDLRVYAPNSRGTNILNFSPAAITELKTIIIEAYRSTTPNDRTATQ